MTTLDWITVIAVGGIVLMLLDGFRRRWIERRNRVVMKLDRNLPPAVPTEDDDFSSELPNGGARTLKRDAESVPVKRKSSWLKDGRDKVRESDTAALPSPPSEDSLLSNSDVVAMTTTANFAALQTQETDEEIDDEEGFQDLLDDDLDSAPQLTGLVASSSEPENDEVHEDLLDADDVDLFSNPNESQWQQVKRGVQAKEREEEEEISDDFTDEQEGFEQESADSESDYYENEPALLENAYKLATSHFQRPTVPAAPRIEPGFGDEPTEELAPPEHFSAALEQAPDDNLFNEIMDQEAEEIRAWRAQSVTQRTPPPESPVSTKVAAPTRAAHTPEGIAAATDPAPTIAAKAELPLTPHSITRPIFVQPSAPGVEASEPPAAEKTVATITTTKDSFWDTVTGKRGKKKPKKENKKEMELPTETSIKVNQGELFNEPLEPEEDIPTGPQEVLIVNVMAKTGEYFHGADLMPVLRHYGLRLGKLNIFHRHGDVHGNGPVMFSMANIVKPGTFSMNEMDEFMTPGLSFFVQLPNRHGNMHAFEFMMATANGIKQALDGDLKDERRSVFTKQAVEHCRQRIRDFELKLLVRK